MPALAYEFYLLVFNKISRERVRYRVRRSKIKFISTRGHVIFSTFAKHADILFIKQNLARSTITPSITIEIRNPTLHPKTGEL